MKAELSLERFGGTTSISTVKEAGQVGSIADRADDQGEIPVLSGIGEIVDTNNVNHTYS
jgi:hypothetical protein